MVAPDRPNSVLPVNRSVGCVLVKGLFLAPIGRTEDSDDQTRLGCHRICSLRRFGYGHLRHAQSHAGYRHHDRARFAGPDQAAVESLGFTLSGAPMEFHGGKVHLYRLVKIDAVSSEALVLDLLITTPETRQAWERRLKVEWEAGTLSVVSPEGLITLKALRNSARIETISTISGASSMKIDMSPPAVTLRLKQVSQLRRACLLLANCSAVWKNTQEIGNQQTGPADLAGARPPTLALGAAKKDSEGC